MALLRVLLVVVAVLYVGTYLGLSRMGFRRADRVNADGFYFVEPRDEAADAIHYGCTIVYYPLIFIDNLIGTGRPPASAPDRKLK
jgi:hypothetical protein